MLARLSGCLIVAPLLWAQLNEGHYYLRSVPDVPVTLITGEQRSLHHLLQSRAVLLTLFSSRCQGLCSPYLLYLKRELASPREFAVVALSFDPRDRLTDVAATAHRFGLAKASGWTWGLLHPTGAMSLLSTLGYAVRYDSSRADYDHSIVLFVLDRRGNILRRMEGFQDPALLKDLAREARGEFVLSYPLPSTDVALRCFELDKETGSWRLSMGMALLLVPPIASFALAGLVQLALALRRTQPPQP
ncbi:MAG: hypothetical protein NZ473_02290 [Candidatus Kapabacteria bacterium]|nr:hypothetical protein [Candidatus Kapabacteria bacterium]MDW8225920.1 hypothetical protein [Bacteroidota bacterium]